MKTITIYRRSDGAVVSVKSFNKAHMERQLSKYPEEDFGYIEGSPDLSTPKKVVNGAFVDDDDKALEEKWRDLRSKRNRLLSQTDWTQTADSPANKVAWKAYRKELRDITKNLSDPGDVVWPDKPE